MEGKIAGGEDVEKYFLIYLKENEKKRIREMFGSQIYFSIFFLSQIYFEKMKLLFFYFFQLCILTLPSILHRFLMFTLHWLPIQKQATRHTESAWGNLWCCFLSWLHHLHLYTAGCGNWEDSLLPWTSGRDVFSYGLCICSSKLSLHVLSQTGMLLQCNMWWVLNIKIIY